MNRRTGGAVGVLALVVLALAAARTGAAAPCPPSTVTLGVGVSSISTAAVFDTVGMQGECRWNVPEGVVYLYSAGWLGGPYVDAYDDYDVTGVAIGTPVNLTAELTVDGAVWTAGCGGSGCGGFYSVDFLHGADSLGVLHSDHLFTGRLDHHDVLELPLTITAGQPERLHVRAHGARSPGGAHESEANCVLRFRGLPEGVDVVSCKGFPGMAVPTQPASWGRLKSLYR